LNICTYLDSSLTQSINKYNNCVSSHSNSK